MARRHTKCGNNANRLDKVSYMQLLVLVVSRVEEHSLRPQVVVARCMTRCQFVFNVGRECPNKIARIQIPTGGSCPRVEGKIGKVPCSMLVDTGAEKTMVSAELVQPERYLGKTIPLTGFNGRKMHAPIAKVWIKVGEYGIPAEVAVVSNAPEMVYLGVD